MKSDLIKILASIMITLFSFPAFPGVDEGKNAFSAGNYKKAVDEFRVPAEQGNSEAQLLLGLMYGHYWQKDKKESAKWIKKAAEQGVAEAQNQLAMLYGRGTGIRQSSEEAAKWYRKAAEQGHIQAQRMLGKWLSSVITPHDYSESYFWLKKSAEHGDKEAQYELGLKYINGKGVLKDNKAAVMWLKKSAAQGERDAQLLLGLFYEEGIGVPKNNKLAKEWFKAGDHEKDIGEELFLLSATFAIDIDGNKNNFIMNKLFKKSAELGYASGQRNLGGIYASGGEGVTQDYKQTVKWYRKAAEQGDVDAQYNLGQAYGMGQGVTQNYIRAHMWWNIAGASGDSGAVKKRDLVAKEMTSSQLQEAQKLASEWTVNHEQ